MSVPDSTAIAALQDEIIKPVFFGFLDFVGDPIRANTSGHDVVPSGTSDSDLDSHTFVGISGEFVDVSPVRFADGGSESVTIHVSGIPGLDDDTLDLIDDPTNWRGQTVRLWRVIRDATNTQQGGYHNYYTGKMTQIVDRGSSKGRLLEITAESYIAVLSEASNRTYLDQEKFDPGDLSAQAAIAIANGNYGSVTTGSGSSYPLNPFAPGYVGPAYYPQGGWWMGPW